MDETKVAELEARLAALEALLARVAALEESAGAPDNSGSGRLWVALEERVSALEAHNGWTPPTE